MPRTAGIHHVTAISADARRNVAFYAGTLGLRLVKRSVNQDDPTTYHLYYGDEAGSPGTVMTFFPWQGIRRGRIGTGQVAATGFTIPEASLGWWLERLATRGVPHRAPERRFDEQVVAVEDPDGLAIELVARRDVPVAGWGGGDVPAEHAIRGFHGVTIRTDGGERTRAVLRDVLGYDERGAASGEHGATTRFISGNGGVGAVVDVREAKGFPRGVMGGGTVHHVAFRAADDADQAQLRRLVIDAGMHPTPVVERFWFRSVYFHEPGGVLFELATDAPGFAVDEPLDSLGTRLMLPPWLEPHRAGIEAALPDLGLPEPAAR